jgi:HD-GYP domain-containing protein (c-di-GMP phosphodiesterase class II)
MALMLLFGVGFSVLDYRFNSEKQLRKHLDILVDERTNEIKLNQEISVEAFALLAEYREQDTGNHLKRVQFYVKIICEGLSSNSKYSAYLLRKNDYIDDLMLASILHDIGKVAIPNEILLKPGKLSSSEFEEMKKHASFGGELLGRANSTYKKKTGKDSYLALARDIAMHHHEKWDGTGYPMGLKKEEIPLSARIVALCDVYDAVTIDRVYKKAWDHNKAKNMIIKNRGTHFDPIITDVFISVDKQFDEIRKKYCD